VFELFNEVNYFLWAVKVFFFVVGKPVFLNRQICNILDLPDPDPILFPTGPDLGPSYSSALPVRYKVKNRSYKLLRMHNFSLLSLIRFNLLHDTFINHLVCWKIVLLTNCCTMSKIRIRIWIQMHKVRIHIRGSI
jgi:hypothetical protein